MNDYDFIIYTDGAYSSNRSQGGIGVVYTKDNKTILKELSQHFPKGANSARMELMAGYIGISQVNVPSNLLVVTDSEYLRKGATGVNKRKKNIAIWAVIDKAIQFHKKVDFIWTKGHADDPLNKRADKLAVDASHLIKL